MPPTAPPAWAAPGSAGVAPSFGGPRMAAGRSECQSSKNRAKASPLTGSSSARAAAKLRRLIRSSISGAQNSCSPIPCLKRPCTSERAATSWLSADAAVDAPNPNASATSSTTKGPRERAKRNNCPNAPSTTSGLAATPAGTGTPRASRSTAASDDAANTSRPPTRTCITRVGINGPNAERNCSRSAAKLSSQRPAATSAGIAE